mmetsp:Transcript_81455/g.113186  ORF Transcript_81455/g.113186 Transcript_81455/m.113186 type:complete len:127 (+) Transcript_81455:27-407(+)
MAAVRATMRAAAAAARPTNAVLRVTKNAAKKIQGLMAEKPEMNGLRISVRTRGCSGNAFHLEYATEKEKFDEEVDAHGVKVWVDSKAILKVLGSTMDYVEDDLSAEFVFDNPNAKGMCGCGESWHT